jgi:hypothetical protein
LIFFIIKLQPTLADKKIVKNDLNIYLGIFPIFSAFSSVSSQQLWIHYVQALSKDEFDLEFPLTAGDSTLSLSCNLGFVDPGLSLVHNPLGASKGSVTAMSRFITVPVPVPG